MKSFLKIVVCLLIIVGITACGLSSQSQAEDRKFLDLSLEYLDSYTLSKQSFQETVVGGISALSYDRNRDRIYALSDDRSLLSPARFYTLKLQLDSKDDKIEDITIESVTFLKDATGEVYQPHQIDPEGIALSPRETVFIASEGDAQRGINPTIAEYDLKTGQLTENLRIPQRYLLSDSEDEPRGVRDNLGFEALAVAAPSILKDDPFRLFTATEYALSQDIATTEAGNSPIRLMHYVISPVGDPVLVAEHLYLLDSSPTGSVSNGLTELVALPQEGYWLSLERTFGLFGNGAKIFEVVTANATDTSRILQFQGNIGNIVPLSKKLLLDLGELEINLDNLEGMTLGPHLADGSPTLILVSDDNFNPEQITQFLWFRLANQGQKQVN